MARNSKAEICKRMPISLIKHKQTDSPIWSDLLKVRQFYLRGRKYVIKKWEESGLLV